MIIISTQCFPPRTGGIETLMHSLAAALAHSGHEVTVFADGYGGAAETAFDREQPFTIRRFSGLKPWRRRKKAKAIATISAPGKVLAVITDSWKSLERLQPPAGRAVLCLAHGTELPVTCPERKTLRIKHALAKATAVIPNSQYTAERLKAFLPDVSKIHVIHPGIAPPPPGSAAVTRPPGDGPVMISVGRLEDRKGIDSVIKLMPRLVEIYPCLHYFILGDGTRKKHLQTLVSRLGLGKNIHFIGAADKTALYAYLRSSDLFVLPGRMKGDDVEGFGIAFIEAAWFGVPAVAGRAGGAAEAVIDNETGLLCDGNDAEAIYAAIRRLLDNSALREQLGKNAERRARDFVWTEVIKKYLPLLKA